jgi:HD-GYP domain-containing protein (c-di-GMP phosphodiesterase class II)
MSGTPNQQSSLEELARRAHELGVAAIETGPVACDADPLTRDLGVLLPKEACRFEPVDIGDGRIVAVGPGSFDRPGLMLVAATDRYAGQGSPGHRLIAYPREGAWSVLGSLGRTYADLIEGEALQAQSDGFTRHLAQSYENMTLLYRLGRSMNELRRPEQFVNGALEGLCDTLGYLWTAASFVSDRREVGELSGRVMSSREDHHLADEEFQRSVRKLPAALGNAHGEVAAGVYICEGGLGPEVVLHPVKIDGVYAGFLGMGTKRGDDPQSSSYDTQALEAVAGYVGTLLESVHLYEEQQATLMGMLRALSASLDAKDRYTRGHSERVALLGRMLAERCNLSQHDCERIHVAGILHDIGKIGVPDHVLCKPSRLTDDEFAMIKRHPTIGHEILSGIPGLEDVLPGVLYHHERWDGRGYPDGLAGEDIPLMARMLALADTFDSMSSNRAYRAARHREQVLAEIQRCAGGQFDSELVDAFLTLDFAPFDELIAHHSREQIDTQDHWTGSTPAKSRDAA